MGNVMGLDLSINSTGIYIGDQYYIISPKLTKKQKALNHPQISFVEYSKGDSDSVNIR